MIRTPLAAAMLAFAAPVFAASPISGRWVTDDGSGIVAIASCGDSLCGTLAKVLKGPPAGKPWTDFHNPDPKLQSRPLVGVPILTQLKPSGDGWAGRIYDPKTGKSYRSVVARRDDGTLKVQGCIAILCQTMIWKRAP